MSDNMKILENMNWFKRWFTKTFEDCYIVEIYHKDGSNRTFFMKYIKKIDNNILRGKLIEGNDITYCTGESFDYYVKKVY